MDGPTSRRRQQKLGQTVPVEIVQQLELRIEPAAARKARLTHDQRGQRQPRAALLLDQPHRGGALVGHGDQRLRRVSGRQCVHRDVQIHRRPLGAEPRAVRHRQVDAQLSPVEQFVDDAHHLDQALDVVELGPRELGPRRPTGVGHQHDQVVAAVAVHVRRQHRRRDPGQRQGLAREAGGAVPCGNGRLRQNGQQDEKGPHCRSRHHRPVSISAGAGVGML